jgi:hypothetical protein
LPVVPFAEVLAAIAIFACKSFKFASLASAPSAAAGVGIESLSPDVVIGALFGPPVLDSVRLVLTAAGVTARICVGVGAGVVAGGEATTGAGVVTGAGVLAGAGVVAGAGAEFVTGAGVVAAAKVVTGAEVVAGVGDAGDVVAAAGLTVIRVPAGCLIVS